MKVIIITVLLPFIMVKQLLKQIFKKVKEYLKMC